MIYPIVKGDLLTFNGMSCIAASKDYTKLIYSQENIEYARKCSWYEGGTATGVVDLLFPQTGEIRKGVVIDGRLKKVASIGE